MKWTHLIALLVLITFSSIAIDFDDMLKLRDQGFIKIVDDLVEFFAWIGGLTFVVGALLNNLDPISEKDGIDNLEKRYPTIGFILTFLFRLTGTISIGTTLLGVTSYFIFSLFSNVPFPIRFPISSACFLLIITSSGAICFVCLVIREWTGVLSWKLNNLKSRASQPNKKLKTAEQVYAQAQFKAGVGYLYGLADLGIIQDYNQANEFFTKAAEQGHAEAQYHLALMYAAGEGVLQDYKEAFKWYRKAAEQGHAEAPYNLGVMYANGQGALQDDKEAVKWYRKAAEQGGTKAQYNLGVMYENGQGVPQDYKQAVKWYTKAAEQGLNDAQYHLANRYRQGQGVLQDNKQAVEWYTKAAEQGHAQAQFNLGGMYTEGRGVPQDYKQVVKWYIKAAEQGYVNAQYNLGFMYGHGQGVPQDYKQAVKWYTKAAEQGDTT